MCFLYDTLTLLCVWSSLFSVEYDNRFGRAGRGGTRRNGIRPTWTETTTWVHLRLSFCSPCSFFFLLFFFTVISFPQSTPMDGVGRDVTNTGSDRNAGRGAMGAYSVLFLYFLDLLYSFSPYSSSMIICFCVKYHKVQYNNRRSVAGPVWTAVAT